MAPYGGVADVAGVNDTYPIERGKALGGVVWRVKPLSMRGYTLLSFFDSAS